MIGKKYIAITLVMVFLGKLITVDADFFSFILEANQVVLLNHVCEKKKNDFKETGENLKIPSPIQTLKIARTCSNNYQIIAEKEFPEIINFDYMQFSYETQMILIIHSRKLYPPPKHLIDT